MAGIKDKRQQALDAAIEANGARMRAILLKARDNVQTRIIRAVENGRPERAAFIRDTLYKSLREEYSAFGGQLADWSRASVESVARQWVGYAVEDIPGKGFDPRWAVFSRKYLQQQVDAHAPGLMPSRAAVRAGDLPPVLGGMLREDVEAVRKVVREVTELQAATGLTAQQWRKEVTARVIEERPAWQFIDRAGKHWTADNYFNMLNRTLAAETARESYLADMAEAGHDLATIEGGIPSNCCPDCQAWAGKIVSTKGLTKGYPTYAAAREAGVFHPRCRHYLGVVLPGEEQDAADAEKKMRAWASANGFPVTAKKVQPNDVRATPEAKAAQETKRPAQSVEQQNAALREENAALKAAAATKATEKGKEATPAEANAAEVSKAKADAEQAKVALALERQKAADLEAQMAAGNTARRKGTLAAVESGPAWTAKVETAHVIGPDGTLLKAIAGRENSVVMDVDRSLLKNAIVTHNHPDGVGFSSKDLAFAGWGDLAEMRAFGTNKAGQKVVYSVKRPEKGWPENYMDIPAEFKKQEDKIRRKLAKQIADGKLTMAEALEESKRQNWKALFEEKFPMKITKEFVQ